MGCQSSDMTQEWKPTNGVDLNVNQASLGQIDNYILNSNSLQAEKIGDEYFRNGKFIQAIQTYQKIIEGKYSIDYQIEGLGNSDHAISRYQWWTYKWYNQRRTAGKFKGNVFDALSLCYCHIRNLPGDHNEKGILWYEDMLGERDCYQLYIGYANILYSVGRYQEALKIYNKIIALKPNLINCYVSIAMMYEYRRIEKPKAKAMALKILQMDPLNMYAHFILARNNQNKDLKIKMLKVAADKFPEYIRIVNDVGIAYGSLKEHQEAIVWYKKCIEQVPEYAPGFNNVGVRTQMLELYKDSLFWYMSSCQLDHEYKAAHTNATDIFDRLNYTDENIFQQMKKFPKLDNFMFYYYLGLAYYDKKKVETSIKWYKRAQEINNKHYELMNSFGISYDEIKDYKNAQLYYLKCIQLNPKYHNPYYNLGYLFKAQNNVDKAIEWYKKALEVNPRYHKCFNNLANIYKDRHEYSQAIEYYKKAVQSNSTYTLGYVNLGVCYIIMELYQDAFNAFERAKEILPTDNNGMSQSNKNFLNQNLQKFEKQGETWRKTGSINAEQQQNLKNLIRSFQLAFKQIYSSGASFQRKDEIVLKRSILQLANLVYQDKFQLKNIDKIFALVKQLFQDDEEYFHIIPQLFIQYFWENTINKNRPILDIEFQLHNMITKISKGMQGAMSQTSAASVYNLTFKMKNFNPPNSFNVNLFKNTSFFNSYQILYSQIVKVNSLAEQSLTQFTNFVEAVRLRCNGISYGVNMKLPKRSDQQFKVILRILEKMFKKEIDEARVKSIISKIDKQVKARGNDITLTNIIHEIMDIWTKQITLILHERNNKKIQTTCGISDLLRGKIMLNTVEDLAKALDACDKMCHLRGYQILELDNRLAKKQTMDIVLKIQVNQAVCEFQLAMKSDVKKYHFIHSVYEIERSPLGCLFGSYLFMSKGFSYPILANCKDIEARLKSSSKEEDKNTVEAVKYIINALEQKRLNSVKNI